MSEWTIKVYPNTGDVFDGLGWTWEAEKRAGSGSEGQSGYAASRTLAIEHAKSYCDRMERDATEFTYTPGASDA